MVITMPRLTDRDPYQFGREAKGIQPGIAVILLLTDTSEIPIFYKPGRTDGVDKVFYWNGDSSLFFAITKYVEDLLNADADTRNGFVRVLLLVEDSPKYYSMFLPTLYKEIMLQTHDLISESLNEQEKTFRKRARPKIILAETYEDALEKYTRYRENILGVITDVTYPLGGRDEEFAGLRLAEKLDPGIPVLVQSSDEAHRERALALGGTFMGKQSDRLLQELRGFFKESLGFGDFVFRNRTGENFGSACDLTEFLELVEKVPAESILYHAGANHFSNWLMARGEVEMALRLRPKKVSDFGSEEEVRKYLAGTFRELDRAKRRGTITDFWQQNFDVPGTFTRLGGGSLGGKGRGLAFLFALFSQMDIDRRIGECHVRIPDTLVIGTDAFDRFMDAHGLRMRMSDGMPDRDIKAMFLEAPLPDDIVEAMRQYLEHVTEPIAVRSSSLLEDSQNQPFAGIYSTFMLPNNCSDGARLSQLLDAIRLVYASAFLSSARAYIQTTLRSPDEEKMAIVLQKIVGNRHGGRFYPVLSGVAQSYNFYPVAPLKREDGIVSVALGLGKTVVEGEKVLSFSPANPTLTPGFSTPADAARNTQGSFYSLDMAEMCHALAGGDTVTLTRLPVAEAEADGTLDYVASTYVASDGMLRDGTAAEGPRIVTFAGVLKYGMLPLPGVIKALLEFGSTGMGTPVEIEFAMRLDECGKPEFNVLQIRQMMTMRDRSSVIIAEDELGKALVHSRKALGNGTLLGVRDVVFVSPSAWDNTRTREMAAEVGMLNDAMGGPYLLIGPGRWGTRDRFLGIPVEWKHISKAAAIVEVGLDGFRVDPSHGTHFFHNITSLGIMYFTVPFGSTEGGIRWDWLESYGPAEGMAYARHARLPYELEIRVDGRSGLGTIRKND
jgi:hypothetical protein